MRDHIVTNILLCSLVGFAFTSLAPEPVSIELNWPDRFVASVSHGLGYSYDNLNQREKIEKINDLITVRTKQENETVEIRWKPENILQPNCEQETIGNWTLMPRDWFAAVNKSLIRVVNNFKSEKEVQFYWRFRVRASHLATLFFLPKEVPPRNYGDHSKREPKVEFSKLKNIVVEVVSSPTDPTWPEMWTIHFDLPESFKNQHLYSGMISVQYEVKKNYKEDLLPLYFDKLFEVPSYIKNCVKIQPNPPTQSFEDEEDDF